MRALLLLFLLAPGATAGERAFVSQETPRRTVWAGEVFPVTLRLGVDRDFFERQAVPLFRREMDLPLKVVAPGWDRPPAAKEGLRIAFNDDVVRLLREADESREGRVFLVLSARRSILAERPGSITLPPPALRYAYAESFREDLFGGRVPEGRREVTVTGSPLAIRVRPLPESGRPRSFAGAVGRFTIRANAPETAAMGESFRLRLILEGDGNLRRFPPPDLSGLEGFHVYGVLDDRGAPRRTITVDLAPTEAGRREIPAIPVAYFDPDGGTYRVIRTRPIPLLVTGEAPGPGGSPLVFIVSGIALLVGLGILLRWRAGRGARPREPTAADTLAAALEDPGADLEAEFTLYLSTRLAISAAALVGPGLGERLRSAGVPHDLADRAALLMQTLVAVRYGGEGGADPREEVRAVLAGIEAHLPQEE